MTAAAHLVSQPLFQQSQHIACYVAYYQEMDPTALIQQSWQVGKKCYLPQLTKEKTLHFALYSEGDTLVPNQYGILEPLPNKEKIAATDLDVVVMPLVAFDLLGHRLVQAVGIMIALCIYAGAVV